MLYFRTLSDLKFMNKFMEDVRKFKLIENKVDLGQHAWMIGSPQDIRNAVTLHANENNEYKELRQKLGRAKSRATDIADRLGSSIRMVEMPYSGGPATRFNIINAILTDDSQSGVSETRIIDALNDIMGRLESKKNSELWKLFNPFNWFLELFGMILSLPFRIISATGFNTSKIEDHLWGRVFKIVEAVIYIILGLYLGSGKIELLKNVLESIKPK